MNKQQSKQVFAFRLSEDEKRDLETIARALRKKTGDYASASTVARMAIRQGIEAVRQSIELTA